MRVRALLRAWERTDTRACPRVLEAACSVRPRACACVQARAFAHTCLFAHEPVEAAYSRRHRRSFLRTHRRRTPRSSPEPVRARMRIGLGVRQARG